MRKSAVLLYLFLFFFHSPQAGCASSFQAVQEHQSDSVNSVFREQGGRYNEIFHIVSDELVRNGKKDSSSVPLTGYSDKKKVRSYNQISLILLVLTVSGLIIAFVFFIVSLIRTFNGRKSGCRRKRSSVKAAVKKQNGSLLYEIIGFSYFLIFLMTVFVSVPFYRYYIEQAEYTLSSGLLSRVNILMSELSCGVRTYMSAGNLAELSMIPERTADVPEVQCVTVVGFSARTEDGYNGHDGAEPVPCVLASNAPAVCAAADASGFVLNTLFTSAESAEVCKNIRRRLNEIIIEENSSLLEQRRSLYEEKRFCLQGGKTSLTRSIEEIDEDIRSVSIAINKKSERLAGGMTVSLPEFDVRNCSQMQDSYLFFRPIIYAADDSDEFICGLIFLQVSTDSLVSSLNVSDRELFLLIFIIVGIVLVLGCVGALLVGWHISAPLRRLEEFVLKITAERHRKELDGERPHIVVSRNDEIGRLCIAVNQLNAELAAAAIEDNPTYDGKAVQKAFLPLDKAPSGFGQEATASHTDENIELFGFYKGASSVSGDYFDYKRLDERWYVFIKSDVSGHGTPAGLIMTIIAVLFNRFFDGWSVDKKGSGITKFVYQTNSFLEALGLDGKFATIIIILFDSKSGCMYLCNAGDNLVHIYDADAEALKTLVLKETPAAGPFSSALIDSKGGFVLEKSVLAHGNVLFLYTDGIEEAARLVRDDFGTVVQEERNGRIEAKKELFGARRVRKIIEAVFSRGTFTLTKKIAPAGFESLVFDFSTCQGNAEEAITALAAVEKVFRMYKPFSASESDIVKVDSQTDMFLMEHFTMYKKYCSVDTSVSPREIGRGFIHYNFVKEDEQTDDLTLFAIKRR